MSVSVPALICVFVHSKQRAVPTTRIASLYGSQPSSVFLCIQNSDFSTTIAKLYVSPPSSVVLCMQNGVISTRITSLYGSLSRAESLKKV